MSAHIEWLTARYTTVDKHSKPGQFHNDGSENDVACITITGSFDGDGAAISGRPEDLVKLARQILAAAEEIVVETMRDPDLRALYGITSAGTEPQVKR